MKITFLNNMSKIRSISLFLAGCLFVFSGLLIIYNQDFSHFLLKNISLLKEKAVTSDWPVKLKSMGLESVKCGILLFIWGVFAQFFIRSKFNKIQENAASITIFKREYLCFTLSLFSSVILYILIAFIITKLYNPDIDAIRAKAAEMTILDAGNFHPKPVERLLFLTGLASIPAFLLIFYLIYKTSFNDLSAEKVSRLYSLAFPGSIIVFLSLAVAGLLHSDPDHYLLNVQFYFLKSLPYLQFALYALAIFPLVYYLVLHYQDIRSPAIRIGLSTAIVLDYTYIFLLVFFINIFTINYPVMNISRILNSLWSFSAVYYSMTQVAAGQPMLINGFTNTYGLYPHFLAPIFNLTGLNVLNFSIVMSITLCLSFLFLLLFLYRSTDNKILVLLGFTSAIFLAYMLGKIVTWDFYFQYHPLRFFFPMMLLMLGTFYYEYRKKGLYYISFILYSLSILWNPDSGIVVFLSWLFYLCYLEFENMNGKKTPVNIILHFTNAAAVLIIIFTSYSVLIRLFYGNYPDIFKMFTTISVFSGLGFGMLPMPLIHPWNIVILSYLCGFLYAIAALINKRIDKKVALILLVCLAGSGAFSYYEGRSHNWNLVNVWCYFFILLTLFADLLINAVKRTGLLSARSWAGIVIFILSFSFLDIFTNSGEIYALIFKRNCVFNKTIKNSGIYDPIEKNTAFINKYAIKGEKIIVLSKIYEGIYLNRSGKVSAFNPGFSEFEIFMKNDAERLKYILTNDRPKIFYDNLSPADDKFFSFIRSIMDNYYKKTDSTPDMVYYSFK